MDEKGQVIGVAALENKQGQNVNHVLVRFSIPFASRGIYPTGSSSISAKGPGTGTNSAIRGAHGHAYFKRTDADPDKLVTYAERIGNGAIFKRLGSFTERAKGPEMLISARAERLTKGNVRLDPALESLRLVLLCAALIYFVVHTLRSCSGSA